MKQWVGNNEYTSIYILKGWNNFVPDLFDLHTCMSKQ